MLQSHRILSERYHSMARAIMAKSGGKMSEEQLAAYNILMEQHVNHQRQVVILGRSIDIFVMEKK